MKQLIVPIVIIVTLIAFFVFMPRKNSKDCSYLGICSKIVSDSATKPATEMMPAIKTPIETNLLAPPPIAVPVITAKEAEQQNVQAIEYVQHRKNVYSHLDLGYRKIYSANFSRLKGIKLTTEEEKGLQEKGFDISDFNRMLIPSSWSVDFSTIPTGTLFQKVDKGYNISSATDCFRILAPSFDSMTSSFFFDLVVENISDSFESNIEAGVRSSGVLNTGYNTFKYEKIAPGKEASIQWEISVFDHYSNLAPFFSITGNIVIKSFDVYRLEHKDFTIVEGTIQDRSLLPDPQTTDYPDCRFTAHFIGNSIASGKTCKKELVLSIEGFHDKMIFPTNGLKQNDKIKCAIVRFDSVPESLSGIQEADNLNLFELDSYLVTSYEMISSFSDYTETNLGVVFDDLSNSNESYISIFDKQINPSMSSELKQAQAKAIEKDLKRINDMLLPYTDERKQEINSKFLETWEAEKKKDKPGFNRIGKWVWRKMDNSYYALPESFNIIQDFTAMSQENIDSLVAFKDYLESQGIQFIVSIVPDSYDISARVICPEFSDLPDFRTACIVRQLLQNNIEAIYASDIMISKYNLYEHSFYYPGDPHPGDLPQDVLSDILAERLLRFNFEPYFSKELFQKVRRPNTNISASFRDCSFPGNCDIGNHQPGESYSFYKVYYQDQTLKNESNSPIILLSNSFGNTPEYFRSYLSMKSGVGIYYYMVRGTSILTAAIQRIFNSPEKFLKNRKVCILHLGTVHLSADILIPNFRELDMNANVTQNKKLIKKIGFQGNTTSIPEYASRLSNSSFFKTETNGYCTIVDRFDLAESGLDASQDSYLVFTYYNESKDRFELEINGMNYPLTGVDDQYMWLKKTVPLPAGISTLTIKAKGKKEAYIAIGGIQLYQ